MPKISLSAVTALFPSTPSPPFITRALTPQCATGHADPKVRPSDGRQKPSPPSLRRPRPFHSQMPLPAPRGCSHDLRGQDWPRSTQAFPLPNVAPSTPRVFAQPKGTGLAQVVRRTLASAPMTLVCPQVSTPSQYSDWRTPRATPHNGWRNRLRLLANQQNSYWTANGHRAMHAGRNGGPPHTYVPCELRRTFGRHPVSPAPSLLLPLPPGRQRQHSWPG